MTTTNGHEEVIGTSTEIMSVTTDTPSVLSISQIDVRELARTAKERVQALRELIDHALDVTDFWDWVIMGGGSDPKVYLTAAGAEKVARLFSVSWQITKKERHDRETSQGEKYYFWEYTGVFKAGGIEIVEMGTCSSRDQFFAKNKGEWIPSADVDETNVMKAAYTNCITRGITGIIGLRNFPLSRLPGKLKDAPRVTFDGQSSGGKASGGGGRYKKQPQDDETKRKAKQIGAILLELHEGDEKAAIDDLESRTKFETTDKKTGKKKVVNGKRRLADLTKKQTGFLLEQLQGELDRRTDEIQDEPSEPSAKTQAEGKPDEQESFDIGDENGPPWDE